MGALRINERRGYDRGFGARCAPHDG